MKTKKERTIFGTIRIVPNNKFGNMGFIKSLWSGTLWVVDGSVGDGVGNFGGVVV